MFVIKYLYLCGLFIYSQTTEPQPLQKWDGIWEANFTVECAQLDHVAQFKGDFKGQEDCLYLNIYVPRKQIDELQLLDVIVDIHGGGFNFGSNRVYTGPKYIMDKDIILVTINYRLGPLGFLSTEDDVVPGNNGMKDQVAALKWVKHNIKAFGGNPNSVTLTGLSAGGASVHLHYLSPLSKGLFKGGISLSGNALCPWVLVENSLQKTIALASAVGCSQSSTTELVNCLKRRSAKQIVESGRILRPWLMNPFTIFGIVVEKHGKNRFLPGHPYELLSKGEIHDLPWITSIVSHEGLYPVADFLLQDHYFSELNKHWEKYLPYILHYDSSVPPEFLSSTTESIKKYYLKDKSISINTYPEIIEMASDRLFVIDSIKAARLQAKANKSPTYYYYFDYKSDEMGTFTLYFSPSETRHGVCHGDDLLFVYHNPKAPIKKLSTSDEIVKNLLLHIWTSFARAGVPEVNGAKWTPVNKNLKTPLNYLHIKSPSEIITKQIDNMGHPEFWNSLPLQENEHLFPELVKDEL